MGGEQVPKYCDGARGVALNTEDPKGGDNPFIRSVYESWQGFSVHLKEEIMKRITIGVTLLALLMAWGAIGQAQFQVKPLPIQREEIPTLLLDISCATFTQGATGTYGTWFIPIKDLQAILNAPPTQDTPIGVVMAGPNLAIVKFRVVSGTAHFSMMKLEMDGDQPIVSVIWQGELLNEVSFKSTTSLTPWASAEGPWRTTTIARHKTGDMKFPIRSPDDPTIQGKVDVDIDVWRIHVHIHVEWD